ncbi:hydrogenase nickel incorporation protein HypB [Zoogloea sp.]|uniref:hydrogenase nickel incorporation protein HypB n=1 Tax=Zoogloea sp. TaxID=49181 RepID=UPI002602E98F|nr:hydrogenase nickel incorporation protein HypB [Zoogloea sp.]MDD3354756.1 hydrogenase nickel incorporation protein HypB [Zoogloea sp.]
MCNVCGCGAGEARIEGQSLQPGHAGGGLMAYRRLRSRNERQHLPADSRWVAVGSPVAPSGEKPLGESEASLLPSAAPAGLIHYGQGAAGGEVPGMSQARMVRIEQDILGRNNVHAARNRAWLAVRGILALNLVSSPGSGKTSLLVRTIEALRTRIPLAVVEGDQQTSFDAERIRATGAPALQINTGKGCHLDARMVEQALEKLSPVEESVVLIENVGNLVCPAAFDLGEAAKVVVLSVTEGEDKPLKYPDMFAAARLMLLNKVDLLPYLSFDVDKALDFARRVNPGLEIICLSATTGSGFSAWLDWIEARRRETLALRHSAPLTCNLPSGPESHADRC